MFRNKSTRGGGKPRKEAGHMIFDACSPGSIHEILRGVVEEAFLEGKNENRREEAAGADWRGAR